MDEHANDNGAILAIGSKYGGGIIVHMEDGGRSGLICRTEIVSGNWAPNLYDDEMYDWVDIDISDTCDGMGEGRENTERIWKVISDLNSYPRALRDEAQTKLSETIFYQVKIIDDEFKDWYIPSLSEIDLMRDLFDNVHLAEVRRMIMDEEEQFYTPIYSSCQRDSKNAYVTLPLGGKADGLIVEYSPEGNYISKSVIACALPFRRFVNEG